LENNNYQNPNNSQGMKQIPIGDKKTIRLGYPWDKYYIISEQLIQYCNLFIIFLSYDEVCITI
jgi:hypothetical protein